MTLAAGLVATVGACTPETLTTVENTMQVPLRIEVMQGGRRSLTMTLPAKSRDRITSPDPPIVGIGTGLERRFKRADEVLIRNDETRELVFRLYPADILELFGWSDPHARDLMPEYTTAQRVCITEAGIFAIRRPVDPETGELGSTYAALPPGVSCAAPG